MRLVQIIAISLILSVGRVADVNCQGLSANQKVLRSALAHAIRVAHEGGQPFTGGIVLDSRILPAHWSASGEFELVPPFHVHPIGEDRPSADMIAQGLARTARFETAISCEPTCPMGRSELYFALSDPEIRGDTAKVVVSYYRRRSDHDRAACSLSVYTLVRKGGAWEVVDRRSLGVC